MLTKDFLSRDYPEYLSKLSSQEREVAPTQMFFEGDFTLMSKGLRVSVVGSRDVSELGVRRAELISEALVQREITIVSGLAEGVDTIAHTTAIKKGGKTIAVLGTPIDKCFPAQNKELLSEIKKNHLAISQFESGSRVFQSNFPLRNKTMALISEATVIIEATEKSGTRHQAWEAIRLGRTVFLMENLVKNKDLEWPLKLLKYGAIVLTSENYKAIFDELHSYSFVAV
jgi:DNA processing protein